MTFRKGQPVDVSAFVRKPKPDPVDYPKWLSLAQAAEYLGVGRKTAEGLGHSGQIPMFRITRLYKMRLVDVEAYVERARVVPVGERVSDVG